MARGANAMGGKTAPSKAGEVQQKPSGRARKPMANGSHSEAKRGVAKAAAKSEPPGTSERAAAQPTSEQLLIAQLMNDDDVAGQRVKIENVMDVTGKEEDLVATALFDAGWDESAAVEMLLESPTLGQWEESGSRKKKNKTRQQSSRRDELDDGNRVESKDDDWDDSDKAPSRERSFVNSGPRGGRRGGRGGGGRGSYEERESRRGRPMEFRGSRGSRGRGSFRGRGSGNQDRYNQASDNWDLPEQGGRGRSRGGGRGGNNSSGPGPRGPRKDPFDNAANSSSSKGNWGDDFPAAEDWDNEEYTGSLADTKVFTASSTNAPSSSTAAITTTTSGVASNVPSGETKSSSPNVALSGNTGTYSQPIDLTTLLQKPSTQSAITTSNTGGVRQGDQQQSLMQNYSQKATESLKAAVGIGGYAKNNVSGSNDLTYYSTPDESNRSKGYNASGTPSTTTASIPGSAFSAIKPLSNNDQLKLQQQKSSAVEMPAADPLARLDVQFGGMELQFGSGYDFEQVTDSTSKFGVSNNNGDNSNNVNKQQQSLLSEKTSEALSTSANTTSLESAVAKLNASTNYGSTPVSQPPKTVSTANIANTNASYNKSSSSETSTNNSKLADNGNVYASANYSNYNSNSKGHSQQPYGSNQNYSAYQSGFNSNTSYANTGGYQTSSYPQQRNDYYNSNGNSSSYRSQQQQYMQPEKYASGENNGSNNSVVSSTQAALGLTSTTNALNSKVSAGKVGVAGFPPGMQLPPTAPYMMSNPAAAAAAAMYGFPAAQPMYSPAAPHFNASSGIDELAAMHQQRPHVHQQQMVNSLPNNTQNQGGKSNQQTTATSSAPGFYDPSFGSSTASNVRATDSNNSSNVLSSSSSSTTTNAQALLITSSASNDIKLDPIPSTTLGSNVASTGLPQQQANFNLAAANAFQGMPPGYAFFYNQMPGLHASAYGHHPSFPTHPPPQGVAVNSSQFQKPPYQSSYGSYDAGMKEYYGNGVAAPNSMGGLMGNVSGKGGNSGSGSNMKNHQYWNNSNMNNGGLW